MNSSLLIVGSVALDTLETRAGKREEILGGAATYASLAASHFCPVNLVAVVGSDFADAHIERLSVRKINLDGLEKAKGRTFRWAGVYAEDFSSRETLSTELGVFEFFDPKIPPAYLKSKFALLGNIHPALQRKVLNTLEKDTFVATDTMNLWIDITREELDAVIEKTNLLVINDEESYMLTGERQIAEAAKALLARGPEAIIIKRGEHGAFLFQEAGTFFAPAVPLPDVIDPTGAGDTFAGGLLGYLAGNDDTRPEAIKKGMIFGAACASATVEGFGVERLADVTERELESRYRSLRTLVAVE